jgi:hypothetical protein
VASGGSGVHIAPGAKFVWNFLRESGERCRGSTVSSTGVNDTESVLDGFTSPWTVMKTLTPHKNPVAGDAYIFPTHRRSVQWFG